MIDPTHMVFTVTIATEKRDILVAMIATAEPLTSVAPHPMEEEDMIDMIDTIHTTGMTITGGLITMPVSGLEEGHSGFLAMVATRS